MRFSLDHLLNSPLNPVKPRGAPSPEPPLRSELYSLEQLQRHARALAQRHHVARRRGKDRLILRLAENERILQAYNEQTIVVERTRSLTPAAEWILDNFYLIEEQVRTARRHLPRGYSQQLPHLTTGATAGFPRVYDLVLDLISHVDGRVDAEHLSSFVESYQSVTNLRIGELWAIPIMLRLAILENLRRLTVLLSAERADRDLANQWTDAMVHMAETNPGRLIVVVAELAQANVQLTRAFVAEFWRRIQGKTPLLQLPLSWLEQRLSEEGHTLEQLIQSESQNQASQQVSVGNSITSLRFLNAMDWRDFVENLSVIEKTLSTDPQGVYLEMDFYSRDAYRHSVENVARRSSLSESEVAALAVDLAREPAKAAGNRCGHVGFFLVDDGLPELERAAGMRQTLGGMLRRQREKHPLAFYLGGIVMFTLAVGMEAMHRAGLLDFPIWGVVAIGALVLLVLSQLAVSVMNCLTTAFISPRLLPRLNFKLGIPPACATIAVVPTMLPSAQDIDDLLDDLEVRYLANRDANLFFALLTDFRDAPQETMPEDEVLLARVSESITNLNEKYQSDRPTIFYLFHRPRRWNERENAWMGQERKRGKLAEFNAFLRSRSPAAFSHIAGDVANLPAIKYVITLDTDTQLPRDAARHLVGAIAHPLNCAQYDATLGRITKGYGVLQPRVAVSLSSATRSRFVKLFSGEPGLDPYTRAVSDVYQDLFKEGSFIGKGIFDVDNFEKAVGSRFPDNRILSHDLLEGSYARSSLVSDVQLYEGFPATYLADVSRRHRWIRGDWQIATWLLPRVPGPDGRRVPNPISALSRWKIFDNLRRSLVPAALMALLLLGFFMPGPVHWSLLGLLVMGAPVMLWFLTEVVRKPHEVPWFFYLHSVGTAMGKQVTQSFVTLALLPYDAVISLDAVVRTCGRLLFTRRRLLEWRTTRDVEQKASGTIKTFFRTMWVLPVVALGTLLGLSFLQPGQVPFALPLLIVWVAAPALAWWISQPLASRQPKLSMQQRLFLAKIARKTWRFFETFVTAEENWLPPDNFQEQPARVLATRTSPTNIGLSMMANLSAYDFGFIPFGQLIERTDRTLGTMEKLEHYRGHLYNWYDTRDLRPLPPLYVSTVDSGNLAGHLLALGPALLQCVDQPVVPSRMVSGLGVTLEVWADACAAAEAHELVPQMQGLREVLARPVKSTAQAVELLQHFLQQLSGLQLPLRCDPEVAWWRVALERGGRDHLEDLLHLDPWLALPQPSAAAQLPVEFQAIWQRLNEVTTLREVAALSQSLTSALETLQAAQPKSAKELKWWLGELGTACTLASDRASQRTAALQDLAERCTEMAEMDFTFLHDRARNLFSIGFNVAGHRLDDSFYDLLASEARSASYVAIALGQLNQDHWFALGRLLTTAGAKPVLISWSGSIFEYLMPLLVMPTYENTLLDASYQAAVERQIEYGRDRGVPWGFSESGYYLTDAHLNYQYRAFGVPGLGFKRGLADDLVVAPYATAMALMVKPEAACRNLEGMAHARFEGAYGFYEAIDFTPARLAPGHTEMIVQSFMAHHQAMSLLSFAYVLLERPMQRRFDSNLLFKATELLLQERVPKDIALLYPHEIEVSTARENLATAESNMRVFTNPNASAPEVHLLSNGRYHVMVSSSGGGYSRWKDLALTRWREDPTRDAAGSFFYLRDLQTGKIWSPALHPINRLSKRYEAIFSQGRAEFRDRQFDIEMYTEICVSPEDDLEIRRLTLTNRSRQQRVIEVTTFAEVVLNTSAADAAHPAFSNLFVQTELMPRCGAILCTRRRRSPEEVPPWMFHSVLVKGKETGEPSFESDRSQFIGRGRSTTNPAALQAEHLSNSQGPVLDPAVAVRRTVILEPDETARFIGVTGVAQNRERAQELVEKYQDAQLAERVIELAWTHGLVVLRQLNATEPEAQLFGRLAGSLLYLNRHRRAHASLLARNRRGQSALWSYGISGDLPILLLFSSSADRIDLVKEILQAHAYWRIKGLSTDLVILISEDSGYRQSLYDQVIGLIASGIEAQMLDKSGGIFVRSSDQISEEDRILLQAAARVVLRDENGTLAEQLDRPTRPEPAPPAFVPTRPPLPDPLAPRLVPRDLLFFNGRGGFTPDGREYVIMLEPDKATPAPWVNVLANEGFGTVISEAGNAYTWSENCHEFRLTPWHNDPVTDLSGEAIYLRDEQTGQFWSPSPAPARGKTGYTSRHGFGYSVFEHEEHGIRSEMWIYVAIDAPVKFVTVKVRNLSERSRKLSVTGYWELVLGELRQKTAPHLQTEMDPKTGAILARNPYNTDFPNRVAFLDFPQPERSFTGNRTEFIGRNSNLAQPAAMRRSRLSGRVGAGLDACAAMQTIIDLAPGEEREITFRVGAARDLGEAHQIIQRFRGPGASNQALEAVWNYWKTTLGQVYVETPDPAVNVLTNGWLLYQTLACRMWARTGFYQSGGAYGFRDQLQDGMALIHADPRLLRAHLLRAAARQFREGDVQHWWHPPVGRGVRTRFSDDYLWLPYATCRYVVSLDDTGVLDEKVPFLEGRPIRPDEEAYYDLPHTSDQSATLYEHCVRAIRFGFKYGEHGLPLMGCGDWNDGMNLVGIHGRGESVWLAFFLYDVLQKFAPLAKLRKDDSFARECLEEAAKLRQNIETHGWDGNWYLRAFFDDGQPLGSAQNSECQIDALPQSWSVISNAGQPQRAQLGLKAVHERLVRRDARLIQLFDPPFDKSPLEPGYIKGYLPGVRENGGQYTHAAIWTIMAFALRGDHDRAWELFSLINPVEHGRSAADIGTYKVEPYVVAADVYAVIPHVGRGGWTWYTGSAGWLYRLVTETLLGLEKEGDVLRINPRPRSEWNSYKIVYRFYETFYHITVVKASGERAGTRWLVVDGVEQADNFVRLQNDRQTHQVEVRH